MGRSGDKASTASVSYRRADDLSEVAREWTAAGIDGLAHAAPWRAFRWRRGQKHYSGTYWSSTVARHVIYESRLELARLLFADFDLRVRQIVAQPFLLRAAVDRKSRKHIPDYLLVTDTGPVVIDVKPARRLSDPKVAFTFEWTRELVEARGWRYEVGFPHRPTRVPISRRCACSNAVTYRRVSSGMSRVGKHVGSSCGRTAFFVETDPGAGTPRPALTTRWKLQ